MAKIVTAERVSSDASDNFVFQRSLLAYHAAADRVSGQVLEIGTGSGYGIEIIAPHTDRFITVDKHAPEGLYSYPEHVVYEQATVPPLPFASNSFDFVISFQVIEHIKKDTEFVQEIRRVLRQGGCFIVTTPNAQMSLTRNPWHVREYTAAQLCNLLQCNFSEVEMQGVTGNEKVMSYFEKNRRSVERLMRFDVLDLQHNLPRWMLQLPYDIMNRRNRRKLLKADSELTQSIAMDDYQLGPVSDNCFDLFYAAWK